MRVTSLLLAALLLTPSLAEAHPGSADGWLHARGLRYLRYRTQTWATNPRALIGHLERARVDPSYSLAGRYVPVDAWDTQLAQATSLEDKRDFVMLDILTVILGYDPHPVLDPGLRPKVEQALRDFKYWLTDPTPPGVVDQSVYWTENHQITYYALEYVAGGLLPDDVFTSDGRTGREHRARAEYAIYRWLDRKARLGFNEFHSDVYYAATLRPLCFLVDFADPEISTRAAMVLDLLLLDLALHNQKGVFGAPHGRSFKKDKTRGGLQDTWDLAKVLFANTRYPFEQGNSVLHLIRSKKYRLPWAVVGIGRHRGTFVDRERMGLPAPDETGPLVPNPPAPPPYDYADPADLDVWWGMGAFTYWPVVPLTFQTLEAYGLWTTDSFSPLLPFRPLVALPPVAQAIAAGAAAFANSNILSEVNTYTWRSRDVSLSTAVDYRPGFAGVESHAWQATLDAEAIVFTNHPFAPLVPSPSWSTDFGYFTGEASWPRSAQHENVAIHIYAPQWYPQNPPPFDDFIHQTFTHAYFPKSRFDDVVQEGGWTIGRKGRGYVALYSWRSASYRPYDPAVFATEGMTEPFDLVAEGGADNVWIVEVGRKATWGSFEAFRDAIVGTQPTVAPRGVDPATGLSLGFDVTYESPSQGRVQLGSTGDFTVESRVVPTGGYPRYDNPWVEAPFGTEQYRVRYGPWGLELDFATGHRELSAGRCRGELDD